MQPGVKDRLLNRGVAARRERRIKDDRVHAATRGRTIDGRVRLSRLKCFGQGNLTINCRVVGKAGDRDRRQQGAMFKDFNRGQRRLTPALIREK